MRFKVPQFIDIEDKIFGPFTFKQFIYLVGGAGISFVAYKVLPLFVAILVILPTLALSLALTFYKINNKPFSYILEAYFKYLMQNKLYLWKKKPPVKKKGFLDIKSKEEEEVEEKKYVPRLSESKLKNISWSLDILDMKQKDE